MTDSAPEQDLGRDNRGAIMVMGVFMAVFLVAMIYYVLGLGRSILFKEAMQDAADTASFGAAVIHARGMNLLALLNMLMASVLAVLVALEVALFILWMSLILAILRCLGLDLGACLMIPVYMSGISTVSAQISAVQDSILSVVRQAHTVQLAVQREIPLAAAAKVRQYGASTYNPPTESGRMVSMSLMSGLPVEVDTSGYPCVKTGIQASMLVFPAVRFWPPGRVWPGWEASVPGLSQAFAAPYCPTEGGGGDAPMQAMRVREGLHLGDDDFQVQAFMRGTPPFALGEEGVGMAAMWTPGGREAAELYGSMEELSKSSFAQAEYYFDDGDYSSDIDRREWLWYMNWRARLRRFRPIEGTPSIGGTPFADLPTVVVH